MEPHLLAAQLRTHPLVHARLSSLQVAGLPDEALLTAYVTCPHCTCVLLEPEALEGSIALAQSAASWVRWCARLRHWHRCETGRN